MFSLSEQSLSLKTQLGIFYSPSMLQGLTSPLNQALLTSDLQSRYRKFGWLRNYALLHLQNELATLEDELAEQDKWEFRDGDPRRLVSRRSDYGRPDSRRREIMYSVHSKLKEYGMLMASFSTGLYTNAVADEALLRMQTIQAIKRPSLRSQRNVHTLIHNTQSLVPSEADWIRERTDLAAIGCAADRGWLNTALENTLNTISRTATRVSNHDRLSFVTVRQPFQSGVATFTFQLPVITHISPQRLP